MTAAHSEELLLVVRTREAAIASAAKAVEDSQKTIKQAKQHHAEVLKNLKELESEQQKAQTKLTKHRSFVESLCLSLSAQAVISAEEAMA